MATRIANVLMHIAGPIVGAEIREIVRDLSRVAGVARVRPGAKLPKLLLDRLRPRDDRRPVARRARPAPLDRRAAPRNATVPNFRLRRRTPSC